MKLPIIVESGRVPTRAHATDAGLDLYATETRRIDPHESVLIGTGVRTAIPVGYVGKLHIRSSLGAKKNLGLANDVGIIDSDYRGEIKAAVQNRGRVSQLVTAGDKIAQLIVETIELPDVEIVDELPPTERGAGGFGSTGQ